METTFEALSEQLGEAYAFVRPINRQDYLNPENNQYGEWRPVTDRPSVGWYKNPWRAHEWQVIEKDEEVRP